MGNLLGAPVVDKETILGQTPAGSSSRSSGDVLEYGMSTMQGWRVHMEDAHICETNLYAVERSSSTSSEEDEEDQDAEDHPSESSNILLLPNHSLFAVFDGHGGTFAAQYSGHNLLRILSRQSQFVEYTKLYHASLEKSNNETKKHSESEAHTAAASAAERTKRLDCLKEALIHTFCKVDQEICNATLGRPHALANQPYHKERSPLESTISHLPNNDHAEGDQVTGSSSTNSTSNHDSNDPTIQFANHMAASHANALDDEDSGTTAVLVMVTPDALVCANAGDSRACYAAKGGVACALSHDHKPDDEAEELRIRQAGGYVSGGRVEGDLAVSRGLGDFRFKHTPTVLKGLTGGGESSSMDDTTNTDTTTTTTANHKNPTTPAVGDQKVSPIPDILICNRNPDQDEFMIVACDGIWDVRSNEECVQDVSTLFEEGESNVGLICEEMLDHCLQLGSKDNMTMLVVKFPAQTIGTGGGVQARRTIRDEQAANQEQTGATERGGGAAAAATQEDIGGMVSAMMGFGNSGSGSGAGGGGGGGNPPYGGGYP